MQLIRETASHSKREENLSIKTSSHMLNFKQSILENISVHFVGNSSEDEGVILSKEELVLDKEFVQGILTKYFLNSFKDQPYYHFTAEGDIEYNEVYRIVKEIFSGSKSFHEQSVRLAHHLYEQSDHPKIKSGEFYIVYFGACIVDEEQCDAIGLFKSENKDTYLKVFPENESLGLDHEQGININKIDKGCLIFDTKKEDGYKVCVIDNVNKTTLAHYWQQDFLGLKAWEDSFFHTENYISLCKGFVEDVFNSEHNVARADQITLLNDTQKFFDEKRTFDIKEFEEEVIKEEEVIGAFSEYKEQFKDKNEIAVYDEFQISPHAVKNNKKHLKSILKLDKNFHVYIHGNRNNMEKGFDEERNQHFYKIFFQQES